MTPELSQAPPSDPDVIPPTRATDPILILVLAFFLGGVSYFVVGQWQKGIAALSLWLCLLVAAIITCGIGSFLFLPLHVMIVLDAYMQAKALQDGHPIGQWTFLSNHR